MERVGNTLPSDEKPLRLNASISHSLRLDDDAVVMRVKLARSVYRDVKQALEKVGLGDVLPEPGECVPAVDLESRVGGEVERLLYDLFMATKDFALATTAFIVAAFHKAARDAARQVGVDTAFVCVDYVGGGGANRETSS